MLHFGNNRARKPNLLEHISRRVRRFPYDRTYYIDTWWYRNTKAILAIILLTSIQSCCSIELTPPITRSKGAAHNHKTMRLLLAFLVPCLGASHLQRGTSPRRMLTTHACQISAWSPNSRLAWPLTRQCLSTCQRAWRLWNHYAYKQQEDRAVFGRKDAILSAKHLLRCLPARGELTICGCRIYEQCYHNCRRQVRAIRQDCVEKPDLPTATTCSTCGWLCIDVIPASNLLLVWEKGNREINMVEQTACW